MFLTGVVSLVCITTCALFWLNNSVQLPVSNDFVLQFGSFVLHFFGYLLLSFIIQKSAKLNLVIFLLSLYKE